jgi:hypothetical protein
MGPRAIERFLNLPAGDRALLVRSVLWLGAARIALWLLPFRVVRRLLARAARPASRPGAPTDRITWAMGIAQRFVPRATCLPQALAAEALLTRGGHPAELRIGVIKTDEGRLEAHAWVESGGRIIVGELHQGLSHYTPLPPLPGAGV